MADDEQIARRLLSSLSKYGGPKGPTAAEAGEALHSLGTIARNLRGSAPSKEVEAIITYVIDKRNEVPTPPLVLEGAVKGAAALGTEKAGRALNQVVWSSVPARMVCEALKGMAEMIPRSSEDGQKQMLKSLERALLTHSSDSVRALAAEYLGRYGQKEHASILGAMALRAPEEHVRNSAKQAFAELAKRYGISQHEARQSLAAALGSRPSRSLEQRREETLAFVERRLRE
ncbi:MAG: HEAT repeat domain-containing protein [Candidatus Micrarchaeota archaeon]